MLAVKQETPTNTLLSFYFSAATATAYSAPAKWVAKAKGVDLKQAIDDLLRVLPWADFSDQLSTSVLALQIETGSLVAPSDLLRLAEEVARSQSKANDLTPEEWARDTAHRLGRLTD